MNSIEDIKDLDKNNKARETVPDRKKIARMKERRACIILGNSIMYALENMQASINTKTLRFLLLFLGNCTYHSQYILVTFKTSALKLLTKEQSEKSNQTNLKISL